MKTKEKNFIAVLPFLIIIVVITYCLAACNKTSSPTESPARPAGYETDNPVEVQEQPIDYEVVNSVEVQEQPTDYIAVFGGISEDSRLSASGLWLVTAVTENAAGTEPDIDLLTDYFQSAQDLTLLRLFDTRFNENLNTEEELNMAAHTAQSLSRYIHDTKGIDALFEPIGDSDKTGWLRSIGVERGYTDPYGGYLDRFTVTGTNPLVINCAEAVYTLDIFSFDYIPECGFDTAERIERFLYRDAYCKEFILDWLRENAGESYSFVWPPVVPVKYWGGEYIIHSHADKVRNTIRLNRADAHSHEYIHIILPGLPGIQTWIREGFAESLSAFIMPYSYRKEIIMMYEKDNKLGAYFFIDEQNAAADAFDALIRERYERYTGDSEIADLDMRALYDAVAAVVTSENPDFPREELIFSLLGPISQKDDALLSLMPDSQKDNMQKLEGSNHSISGNNMSYLEATSFISYLIDVYSLETAMQMLQITWRENPDMVDIFGKDYETLREEWFAFLNR